MPKYEPDLSTAALGSLFSFAAKRAAAARRAQEIQMPGSLAVRQLTAAVEKALEAGILPAYETMTTRRLADALSVYANLSIKVIMETLQSPEFKEAVPRLEMVNLRRGKGFQYIPEEGPCNITPK